MPEINHNVAAVAQCRTGGFPSYTANKVESVLRSLRGWLLGVAGISFVINLLALTGPIFMLQVYDRVLVSGSVPTLIAVGSLALVLYLFFGFLETLRARVLFRMGQQVDSKLSPEIFSLSNLIPIKAGAAGHAVRPVHDLDSLTGFMSGQGPTAIFDMPWLPFFIGVVFLFHSSLGYVALGGAVSICLLVALNEYTSRRPSSEAARVRARRSAFVEESRRNAETIKAMGMSGALTEQWRQENESYLRGQRIAADWSSLFSTGIKTIRFVLQSAILATGAWLAIRQEISPGVMIASSIITSRALSPVEQAVAHWKGFVSARQGLQRLKGAQNMWPEADRETMLDPPKACLQVESIYCSPSGSEEPVLRNVSLDLKAGDGIAILGPSGSGKSTLAKAVVGALPLMRGDIRLDGAAIDQWSDRERCGFVGYLPQDLHLFDGTIAQNIARFDATATSREVIESATLADVHDLIVRLPKGYDTVLGSQGIRLSGGQQQRIALARALFRNPFLVVLDEPNSNLDAAGEAALANALLKMREKGSIVLLVAHRPRALAAVSQVLCLKDGRVAALGPKEDVMKATLKPVRSGVAS